MTILFFHVTPETNTRDILFQGLKPLPNQSQGYHEPRVYFCDQQSANRPIILAWIAYQLRRVAIRDGKLCPTKPTNYSVIAATLPSTTPLLLDPHYTFGLYTTLPIPAHYLHHFCSIPGNLLSPENEPRLRRDFNLVQETLSC